MSPRRVKPRPPKAAPELLSRVGCQHCGAENPPDFTVCGFCNHRRDWYPAPQVTSPA
ncbi:hypothetical protein [Streptomyces sp. NPDC060366]|uniref:hypothetical protein n=1 Tax=Streptomyces sp. NPDC060366 TaxID=3347105 RepID=UPI003661BFF8